MSDHVHAVPDGQRNQPGQCAWHFHFSGVELRCTEHVIPGSAYCPEHEIKLHDTKDGR